ncbi:MAG: amidophosphoribosyltransferase [Clostridia bacterium]
MTRKLNEECGVFGIFDKSKLGHIATTVFYGLFALQHRGQESAGIAVNHDKNITLIKGEGLVNDSFKEAQLNDMEGEIAVGHVRYAPNSAKGIENAQPISVNYAKGSITVAHNGNITNATALRELLESRGAIFHSNNASEIICYLIARARLRSANIEEAVAKVVPMLKGSFSLVIMSPCKLIALRDPLGIRPLCIGKIKDSTIFASETCALETVGATFVRDVLPGEIVIVNNDGMKSDLTFHSDKSALCIFEHVYFARPDSVIDGQSVNEARVNAGRLLAQQYPVDADLVIGVPDSGLSSAIGYSLESGIPYGIGLIKNRYINRTFIQPTQAMRERSVALKLNTLESNVRGKRIIMIDDSIVRGTTLKNIVKLLKKSGAKEVHVRISSPKFLYPCYYGTDIPDRKELAAVKYTPEEMREQIGAESLGFLDYDTVEQIAPDSAVHFCKACFDGKYPCAVDNTVDMQFVATDEFPHKK